MQRKTRDIVCNLGLAAAAIMVYEIVVSIFDGIGYRIYGEAVYSLHSRMFDTWACVMLLAIYSAWLYRIHAREQKTQEEEPITKRLIFAIPVLALGLKGLVGLWFASLDAGLDSIPFFAQSLQSHHETWSQIEQESYFWVLLSVVLVGPIVEELLFRGLVFHYLEKISAGWFPVLLSGIAFGMWHEEPIQCVYAAIIGIGLGIIYAKTRNMKLVMLLHILNNFMAELPSQIDTEIVNQCIEIAAFVMIVPAVIILVRMSRQTRPKAAA